jgi:hypothetical protein
MRLALLVLSLSFVACGGGGGSSNKDLSTPTDLTAPTGDMVKENCLQVVTCGAGCAGSTTCENACAANASTTALQQYNALFGCAYTVCTTSSAPDEDGGTAPCMSNTDSSQTCSNCVTAAAQSGSCSTELAACLGG